MTIPNRPELDALITAAVAVVERMTPEECAALMEAQRQSWARGEAALAETSASPPRVPVSSAQACSVGVESGPGQPMDICERLLEYERRLRAQFSPLTDSRFLRLLEEAAAEIRRLRSDIAAMNDFVDRTLDDLSTARVDGNARYRAGIEAAAQVAERFKCGGCGMDGKAATAIRTLADAPANRGLDTTVALREIATIIERVDNRCAAADGPVSSTLQEMRQDEISRIYALATGAAAPKSEGK